MKTQMSLDKFSLIRRETNVFNAMGTYLMFSGVSLEDTKVFLEEMAEANSYHLLHKPNYWLLAACEVYLKQQQQ